MSIADNLVSKVKRMKETHNVVETLPETKEAFKKPVIKVNFLPKEHKDLITKELYDGARRLEGVISFTDSDTKTLFVYPITREYSDEIFRYINHDEIPQDEIYGDTTKIDQKRVRPRKVRKRVPIEIDANPDITTDDLLG